MRSQARRHNICGGKPNTLSKSTSGRVGTGRRKGLKIPRWQRRVGSSPTARTNPGKQHCGVAMPDDQDDLFGEDADEALDDFDRLTEILFQRVVEFAAEEEVGDELLSPLLLRLALTSRMVAYTATAAKPSGGGLKLDLDRFRRDIEDLIRAAKKDADQFIAHAKESMAAGADPDG